MVFAKYENNVPDTPGTPNFDQPGTPLDPDLHRGSGSTSTTQTTISNATTTSTLKEWSRNPINPAQKNNDPGAEELNFNSEENYDEPYRPTFLTNNDKNVIKKTKSNLGLILAAITLLILNGLLLAMLISYKSEMHKHIVESVKDYINRKKSKGVPESSIDNRLKDLGYPDDYIDEAKQ